MPAGSRQKVLRMQLVLRLADSVPVVLRMQLVLRQLRMQLVLRLFLLLFLLFLPKVDDPTLVGDVLPNSPSIIGGTHRCSYVTST